LLFVCCPDSRDALSFHSKAQLSLKPACLASVCCVRLSLLRLRAPPEVRVLPLLTAPFALQNPCVLSSPQNIGRGSRSLFSGFQRSFTCLYCCALPVREEIRPGCSIAETAAELSFLQACGYINSRLALPCAVLFFSNPQVSFSAATLFFLSFMKKRALQLCFLFCLVNKMPSPVSPQLRPQLVLGGACKKKLLFFFVPMPRQS